MIRIDILLFDGFEELDALAPYEVLQSAVKIAGSAMQVRLVSLKKDGQLIEAAHGLKMHADPYSEQQRPDILIVPGGGWARIGSSTGTRGEVSRGDIPALIRKLHGQGTVIAGVCTGTMLIAAAGILQQRHANTHHIAVDDLVEQNVRLVRARVVDDGQIITSGGVTSGLDLSLWLIERFDSSQAAVKVEHYLEYERRGTVWRNTGQQ